jgi:hypothetical protein
MIHSTLSRLFLIALIIDAWGLDFDSLDIHRDVSSAQDLWFRKLGTYLWRALIETTSEEKDNDPQENLFNELVKIRILVSIEFKWFSTLTDVDTIPTQEKMRKRMLYLFIKDLCSGISGRALETKEKRDNAHTIRVSRRLKIAAWTFIVSLHAGLLFYIYLFARQQSEARQSAWFQSFAVGLCFDIVLSSSAVVVITHLLIPILFFSDIRHIKNKLLKDIMEFRKSVVDTEQYAAEGGEKGQEDAAEMNAAKYLYPSWRIAALFPGIKESSMILKFSTLWPRVSFKRKHKDVSTSYDQGVGDVVTQALSQVFFFFIASLVNLPPFAQDIVVQMLSGLGLGYAGIALTRLFRWNPLLPLAPVVLVLISTHFLLKSYENDEKLKRLNELRSLQIEADSRYAVSNNANHSQRPVQEILEPPASNDVSVGSSQDVRLYPINHNGADLESGIVWDSGEENEIHNSTTSGSHLSQVTHASLERDIWLHQPGTRAEDSSNCENLFHPKGRIVWELDEHSVEDCPPIWRQDWMELDESTILDAIYVGTISMSNRRLCESSDSDLPADSSILNDYLNPTISPLTLCESLSPIASQIAPLHDASLPRPGVLRSPRYGSSVLPSEMLLNEFTSQSGVPSGLSQVSRLSLPATLFLRSPFRVGSIQPFDDAEFTERPCASLYDVIGTQTHMS